MFGWLWSTILRRKFSSAVEHLALLAAVEPEALTPAVCKPERAKDPFCMAFIVYVRAKRHKAAKLNPEYADLIVRTAESYVLDNGILYRFAMKTNGQQCHKDTAVRPIVVHTTMRAVIISEVHDNEFGGGHLGQRATYARLQQRYYWPAMAKDLVEYLKRCRVCAEHNF